MNEKTLKTTCKNKGINFDKNGLIINDLFKNVKPFVAFYYGEYTFYLNMYTFENEVNTSAFEYKLSSLRPQMNKYVDTTNILVMDTEEFSLLYKSKEFEEISNLNFEDAKNIVNLLIHNFSENKFNYDITFQRVEINKDTMCPESKIIISTLEFEEDKYMLGIDIDHFLDHLGFIFEDLENATKEDFQAYIKHNKADWDLVFQKYNTLN
ncbi:Mbov_0400 family ICE element protein [Mycoplasmopsis columboralis]|uniref:Uncharacterized protein n=1 Tax=Mycoplasmopsis columboralis TaxID=171282 RepID=A0A449B5R6_9BACT|nr:hypothetical protein [Mycoplasmopsis columboralis]VEU75950.1 Uncharacterised protein [Mycoplasmopsis columboralis]